VHCVMICAELCGNIFYWNLVWSVLRTENILFMEGTGRPEIVERIELYCVTECKLVLGVECVIHIPILCL